MGVYFGALSFTKPLEKLVLHAVPLQNLLDWLSKPKHPYLVEASVATVPDKALVLVVTEQMLYGEETPLVGVGLVYKPHYISTEPFSAAYMHLHVWHAAGSSVESEDKLNSSCLIFINVSEMSDVIPVTTQHPVLLDVATKETMTRTGEPMAPLSFRGFRLHTVWTWQSGGDLVRQVAFPHFLGETTTSMLEYEPEKFPQGLMQGSKMVINLRPPPATTGTSPWTLSSPWQWIRSGSGMRPDTQHKSWRESLREQKCLQRRHLLLGSLLKLWQVAAELCSQRRPLNRGREPWRLHMKFWNTFTPSISRPCMKWGA